MAKKAKNSGTRRLWFKCLKAFLKLIIKRPQYVYLGEEFAEKSIILSNHVGAKGPLSHELYFPKAFRFWGTYEMNMGLGEVYKYLSKTYYHEKKHWKLIWARLFCLIAAPVAFLFYRGLKLIPTYRDSRLKKTFDISMKVLDEGLSLIIFPEDSHDGYHDELKKFYPGFLVLAQQRLRRGEDLPIYLSYLNKRTGQYVIDKPILTSELLKEGKSREEIAEQLRIRCNELGKMEFPKKK